MYYGARLFSGISLSPLSRCGARKLNVKSAQAGNYPAVPVLSTDASPLAMTCTGALFGAHSARAYNSIFTFGPSIPHPPAPLPSGEGRLEIPFSLWEKGMG